MARVREWIISTVTPDGWRPVTVDNFEDASLLGQYASAVSHIKSLSRFRGEVVVDARTGQEYRLVTDRAILQRLDRQGLLRGPGVRFTYRRRWAR